MKEYQQRVVDEKTDIDSKITSLESFLSTDEAKELQGEEPRRMHLQLLKMRELSDLMKDRVEGNFGEPKPEPEEGQ